MEVVMIRVFVATEYMYALSAIKNAIEKNMGELVGVQSDFEEVSLNRNIRRHKAQILILTLNENTKMYYHIIKRVKQENPGIKIIIITKKCEDIPKLIKKVEGIILAKEGINKLIDAISSLIRGENYCSPGVRQIIDLRTSEVNLDSLTDKEHQVFYLLRNIEDKKRILKILKIRRSTLRTHVQNIKSKLNIQEIS